MEAINTERMATVNSKLLTTMKNAFDFFSWILKIVLCQMKAMKHQQQQNETLIGECNWKVRL